MKEIYAPMFQRMLILLAFGLGTLPTMGQLTLQPEQDCFSAIPVCQEVFTQVNAYSGAGNNPDEINPDLLSCVPPLGEINSVWYTFQIEIGGDLCFTLSPIEPTDDYDWTLFNLTNASCAAIAIQPGLEVACSRDAPDLDAGCNGDTGPDGQTALPCGLDNRACIPVNAGETYVLNISNFVGFDNGYVLDFSNSTAALFDDTAPDLVSAEPACGGIEVAFSENVLCGSVDAADFSLTGPGGPYTIDSVISSNCATGGEYDQRFFIAFSPGIQQAGNFNLSLVGQVSDFCNNPANPSTQTVALVPLPEAIIASEEGDCLEGNVFNFSYGGSAANLTAFTWDLGDGTQQSVSNFTHSYATSGSKTVSLVIRDNLGCSDTATKAVSVFPHPNADFALPASNCIGDSSTFISTSTIDTPFTLTRFEWEFGNGQNSRDSQSVQTFPASGSFPVRLTVFGAGDCPNSIERLYTVFPLPDVEFDISGLSCIGEPISFQNRSTLSSAVAGTTIPTSGLSWSFGDGNTAIASEGVQNSYGSPGNYTVVLSATTSQGCTDSLRKTLNVRATPLPTVIADSACVGNDLTLEALPPENAFTYWYRSETDSVPVFINDFIKLENVQRDSTFFVESVSFEGCPSQRIPITASALAPANLDFSVSDTTLEFPFTGVFFGINGFTQFESISWDFGDGNTSEDPRPFHVYERDGQFTVTAEAVDVVGCTYTFSQQLEVTKPVTAFIPSAFSPNGDGINEEFFISSNLLGRFLIQIFDQYGNEIFRSFDPEFSWDGTFQGKPVAEGVYSYRFRAIDIEGALIEDSGTVTVLR